MNLLMSNLQFSKKTTLTPFNIANWRSIEEVEGGGWTRRRAKGFYFDLLNHVCVYYIFARKLYSIHFISDENLLLLLLRLEARGCSISQWRNFRGFLPCITINFSHFCALDLELFLCAHWENLFLNFFLFMNLWCELGMKGKKINEILMKLLKALFFNIKFRHF